MPFVSWSSDNAAVELVVNGENGLVAASRSPKDLATAIEAVHDAGCCVTRRAGGLPTTSRGCDGALLDIALGVYGAAQAGSADDLQPLQ